jgi:hypothetical protein
MRKSFLYFCGAAVLLLLHIHFVCAQSTEFTYQGTLSNAGSPANGGYDFEFLLYDAVAGGSQLGSTMALNNVAVANGSFTVKLNFGNQFISGANRFLEIRLRPTGQAGMTILTPRQPVTSAPYSIKSLSSENALQLGGILAGQYVLTSDPRMTDPRAPTPGSSNYVQNGTVAQSANFNITGSGSADSFNAVLGYSQGGSRLIAAVGTTNLFAGWSSGISNTGSNNSFFGTSAGARNAAGNSNSFFGSSSGTANISGSFNTFVGSLTGSRNTASENTFVGSDSGKVNVTGTQNAFFGSGSGEANTTGSNNSFFGRNAGALNTAGLSNSFFGHNAGQSNTEGDNNSFFGRAAGQSNTTGFNNSFFGFNAGGANSTGVTNSFFGWNSGRANTTGAGNVFVGWNTGVNNVLGSNNTLIGTGAAVSADGFSYATAIGAGSAVFFSNSVWIGRPDGQDQVVLPGPTLVDNNLGVNGTLRTNLASGGSTSVCRNSAGQLSACSSSTRYKSNISRFLPGLALIGRLRPVSFNWRDGGMADFGLVAEEVHKIEPLLTTVNESGQVEGVKYDRLGVLLINAINEQQSKIAQLERNNETMRKELTAVRDLIRTQAEKLKLLKRRSLRNSNR